MSDKGKEEVSFFEGTVAAGFGIPAADSEEIKLNLHTYLVERPASTFFVRVEGDSMTGASILSGDLLVIDRALTPQNGSIVVAFLNGEFTVKRFVKEGSRILLKPENPRYLPLDVTSYGDFQIWGVVTYVIHSARRL